MPELQLLRPDHAPAILTFETANRAYFAGFVSDRGDAYFEHFADRLRPLLADQDAGVAAFYVLVDGDGDGSVIGRFNLEFTGDGVAKLGYRVAEHVAGRGVATATVRRLCGLAASQHGIRVIRAAAADGNPASRKVLRKAGFAEAGPADPADIGGKQGSWYQRDTAAG